MRKRFVVGLLALSFILTGIYVKTGFAISQNIVISQIQIGTATSASHEFIELYNNASTDVEITNWCLHYAPSTSTATGNKLVCFTPENDHLHLFIPAHGYVFAISTLLAAANPTLGSDVKFSATLAASGHVRLMDNTGSEVDKVGWGTAILPEGIAGLAIPNGKVMSRKVVTATTLQDNDTNSLDFELVSPRTAYVYGQLYEQQDLCYNIDGTQLTMPVGYTVDAANNCLPPPVDVCTNIDGLQITLPTGYEFDSSGICQPDACKNISGLQLVIPDGKEYDIAGNCVDHDMCPNIAGTQLQVPVGYVVTSLGTCMLSLLPITINELLPNPAGSDTGHEFVELYNPNESLVNLAPYVLKVGVDTPKTYEFPAGSVIEARSYIVLDDDDMPFTLVNTTSQVTLESVDGTVIDESPVYTNSESGMAWALISGAWQYTNMPTPAALNQATVITFDPDVEEAVTGLKPCAPNQYRSLDTNRCRLLVTIGSTLTPCKDGQYRSETTNRCRSIASDSGTLTPCSDTQYRSTETNRCRLIASSDTSSLTPCKPSQERNPDTNRCRNVASTSIPSAAFAVQPVADTGSALIGWWALGGIGIVAISYAVWEWRTEIIKSIRKLGSFFHSTK
jgi:Lamin Tail Domain